MLKQRNVANFYKNIFNTKKCNDFKIRHFKTMDTDVNEDGSKEFRISTPWGFVAGKKWGQDGGRKVLAVHGWQDNAGTFDRLVPFLNKKLEIYAIDLPGHGRSSHLPAGILNYTGEYINAVHRVVRTLGLDKFVYLGHSLGSILGYVYASTFPELIDQYIAIENLKPVTFTVSKLPKRNRAALDGLLELERRHSESSFEGYTKEVAAQRMVKGYADSITLESAYVLLKRGLKPAPVGKGFVYSRDPKVGLFSLELGTPTDHILTYGSNIRCEILHIKARPGMDYEPIEVYHRTVEELKKTASSVSYHEVHGTHHVHLNNPDVVAPFINDFIRV